MLQTQTLDYQDDDVVLEAFYAYETSGAAQKPLVLVVHDWSGKNEFACQKAKKLAELGYVGFAVDMYGKGRVGHSKEEKMALMQPLLQQRDQLQKRIVAALTAASKLSMVDNTRISAIGFCFGGLCVLDLARSGAAVKGVVSFHGLLNAPEAATARQIKAKILALHGFADPMVTPDQVLQFGAEMTRAHADWQLIMYGNAMHAFTNPEANDPGFGTVYNKEADTRSWLAMQAFFTEIFEK